MKNKSMDNIITDELVAAFLEGNATAAQCQMILDSLAYDEDLRELLAECIAVDEDLAAMNSLKIARERARSRARVARVGARARVGVRARVRASRTSSTVDSGRVASANKLADLTAKGLTTADVAARAGARKKAVAGVRTKALAGSRASKTSAVGSTKKKLAARPGTSSRRNRIS